MKKCDLIVLCGSAGSISNIIKILEIAYNSYKTPIIIAIHQKETCVGNHTLFSKYNVIVPIDGQIIEKNKIYLIPSMYHTQIERDFTFSFSLDEPINFSRPSIDVLLTTASYAYKDRVCAIIFTGSSIDGAYGSLKISENGGMVIVQDCMIEEIAIMPKAVINQVKNAKVLTMKQIEEFFIFNKEVR